MICQYALLQGDFAAPVRTNKYPREIPELPWYRTAVPQMLMAGAHAVSPAYGRIRACALCQWLEWLYATALCPLQAL